MEKHLEPMLEMNWESLRVSMKGLSWEHLLALRTATEMVMKKEMSWVLQTV